MNEQGIKNPENLRYAYREFGEHDISPDQYNDLFMGRPIAIPMSVAGKLTPKENDRITLIYKSNRNEENRITAVFNAISDEGNWFYVRPFVY